MRKLLTLLFAFGLMDELTAQNADTNYALSPDATEVTNVVSNTPGYMLMLTENGNVSNDSNASCNGKLAANLKSSTSFSLQHYYNKQLLEQLNAGYTTLGGMQGMFTKNMEDQYANIENEMHYEGPIQKKGPLTMGELNGAKVAYYSITFGCIENEDPNATTTKIFYHAMLLTDTDYLLVTNEIYARNIDRAKKYAQETMQKIKSLDVTKVN